MRSRQLSAARQSQRAARGSGGMELRVRLLHKEMYNNAITNFITGCTKVYSKDTQEWTGWGLPCKTLGNVSTQVEGCPENPLQLQSGGLVGGSARKLLAICCSWLQKRY